MAYQQQTSYEYTSTSMSYSSDDNIVRTSSTHISSESQTLIVNAVGANFAKDGQKLGAQDPYLQFSLNFEDKHSFQKTYTAKNGGKAPSWNQSFTLSLAGSEPDLFVEVLDQETTADALIGFAAIPIRQVVEAQGASLNGLFELYDVKQNVIGEINLVLQAQGFQNSSNQQPQGSPVRGQSYVHEAHQKRCKSIVNKEHGVTAGAAVLGGALAIGAGLLGKKLYDDKKEKDEEERQREEEEERQRQEEERRRQEFSQREEELKRREEEFAHRDQEKKECHDEESKKKSCDDKKKKESCDDKKKKKKSCEKKERRKKGDCSDSGSGSDSDSGSGSGSGSDSGSDDDHHRKKKGGSSWDPVGTYSAGDRVKYKGRTYICLQGHTSNPTWKPTDAHSLWEAE